MSHDNYHFTEVMRSLRAVSADLRGRADELAEFVQRVESNIVAAGLDEYVDPRTAFFDNVQRALESATRSQQAEQHSRGALGALMRVYADEYAKVRSADRQTN